MALQREAPIHKLRPTQITIGFIEVRVKRQDLEALSKHQQRDFLAEHMIPAVFGPEQRIYITEHHHLARAAFEMGIESGFFLIEADMAQLGLSTFWRAMGEKRWAHPIDEHGHRQPFAAIPKHLQDLRDDAYRSVAALVRSAGGYDKTPTAYAEFLWANFFRQRIVVGPTHEEFQRALAEALVLARSNAARELPGYRGAAA